MDMDLLSDGSECKNGRVTIVEPGVGYREKSMASLEEQTHRIANTSFTADGCAQATHGFIGDEDGQSPAQLEQVVGRGLDEGNAKVEPMEFEGGGEVAATS